MYVRTDGIVADAVYAVWADDVNDGMFLCRWPHDDGVYADHDAAMTLAQRVSRDPRINRAEVRPYMGKTGLDELRTLWRLQRATYEN